MDFHIKNNIKKLHLQFSLTFLFQKKNEICESGNYVILSVVFYNKMPTRAINTYCVQCISNVLHLLRLCCLYVRNLYTIKCKHDAAGKLGKKLCNLIATDTKSDSS